MHATVTGCRIDGLDVVIMADAPVAITTVGPAQAVARAGPDQ
jgi:hypothetical protein